MLMATNMYNGGCWTWKENITESLAVETLGFNSQQSDVQASLI